MGSEGHYSDQDTNYVDDHSSDDDNSYVEYRCSDENPSCDEEHSSDGSYSGDDKFKVCELCKGVFGDDDGQGSSTAACGHFLHASCLHKPSDG